MAVGGEIKSVLTLDVSKFTSAADSAASSFEALTKKLDGAAKAASGFEKGVSGLGADVSKTVSGFKTLDQTLEGLVSKLMKTAEVGFEVVSTKSRSTKKDIEGMTAAASSLSVGLETVAATSHQYSVAMDSLKGSLKGAQDSQRGLVLVNELVAKSGEKLTAGQLRSNIAIKESNRQTNGEIIASKKKLISELKAIELQAIADAERSFGVAANAEKRLGAFGGKNVISSSMTEALRFDQNAAAIRKQINAEMELVSAKQAENVAIANAIPMMNLNALALDKTSLATANVTAAEMRQGTALKGLNSIIAQATAETNALTAATIRSGEAALGEAMSNIKAEGAIKAKSRASVETNLGKNALLNTIRQVQGETSALALDSMYGENYLRASTSAIMSEGKLRMGQDNERRAADMAHMRQMGQMWKGMAQMWAASKIEQGLAGSVKAADDYSRVVERLDAAGVDGVAGKARTLSIAKQVQSANPNMSKTDSLKLTMSGVAGTVSTDEKNLGVVIPEIAKVLTVMTRQFPEQTHNLEDFGRNVMGVMEARGITNNPTKMLETLDNLSRALILTQGKMSVQDYETISRRGGAGNAQLKDNESILYDIAAASQMKVMGGGGGGAGGVSSFATMQKQAAKRVGGGVKETVNATKNLLEFGVIDREELLAANGGKLPGKNYKAVPYANADKAADNMTKFAMDLVGSVKKKLAALPASDTRFFAKGADRNDDAEQTKAFGRFADQSFGNTNVAEFYKSLASAGSRERIEKEVQASLDAPTYGKDHEEAMKSWGISVDKVNTSFTNLKSAIGDGLIPILQPLLSGITSVVDAFTWIAEKNPIIAALDAVALAIGGVTLGALGLANMFGISRVAVVEALGGITMSVAGFFGTFGIAIATFIAKWASPAGWLLLAGQVGWVFGTWLSDCKVGSLTISEHLQNMFLDIGLGWDRMLLKIEEKWHSFKKFIAGDDYLTAGADAADLAARRKLLPGQQVEYDKQMRVVGKEPPAVVPGTDNPLAVQSGVNIGATANSRQAKDAKASRIHSLLGDNDPATKPFVDPFGKTGSSAREAKVFEDPFLKAFENINAKATETALRIKALVTGEGTYADQAKALVVGKLLGGQFDDAKNPNNRSFLKDGFKYSKDKGYTNKVGESVGWEAATDVDGKYLGGKKNEKGHSLNEMFAGETNILQSADEYKALAFAKGSYESLTNEANEAAERATEGLNGETAAVKALAREYGRHEAANSQAAADAKDPNSEYFKKKAGAMLARARIDASAFAADTKQKNEAARANFLTDSSGKMIEDGDRLIAQHDATLQKYIKSFESAKTTLTSQVNGNGTVADKQAAFGELEKLNAAHFEHLAVLDKQRQEALLTPVEKLALEWKKVFSQIDQMEASWSGGFLDNLNATLMTGTADWVGFTKGILSDVSKMMLKDIFGDATKTMAQAGGNAVKSLVSKGGEAGVDGAMTPGVFTKIGDSLKGFWSNLTGASKSTTALAGSVADVAAKQASEVIGMGTKMTAEQTATLALNNLAAAASSASVSMGGSGIFGALLGAMGGGGQGAGAGFQPGAADFGNASAVAVPSFVAAVGGINAFNSTVPLHAYARGGIARSPQLALFGEAGPEAYVPLPDGRTIPVTMTGGGAASQAQAVQMPQVTINVINQGGQQVEAKQGQPRFDGKQLILDVVLSAASQPGSFRSGMKGALAQ